MPSTSPTAQRWALRLFFLSGLSGILFEVLWTRIFTYLLGSTVYSVTAVITAFLLGLALGTYLFGRIADRHARPLRIFGLLELGVALSGIVAIYAFQSTESLYVALYAWSSQAITKWLVFLLAFVFVSLSATLIGGTLPVLVRYVVNRDEGLKEALSQLYSVNTLGAAVGAMLVLLMVWGVGYETSYHLALALNAVTGLAALLFSRRESSALRSAPEHATTPPPPAFRVTEETLEGRILLPAFAISGFCALAYEIIWFRLLDFMLLGRLTNFACVLSTYLLGISLGSMGFSRSALMGRMSDRAQFVIFEALLGMLGILSLPMLSVISGWEYPFLTRGCGFLLLFAIALLLGGVYPVAGKLYVQPLRLLGRSVGNIYSANAAGSVLGCVLTGFVLIPTLGTSGSLLFIAVCNLSVAAVVAGFSLHHPQNVRWVATGVALAALGLAAWFREDWLTLYFEHVCLRPGFHVIAQREGALEPVMVAENGSGHRILYGGPFQSGETDFARRQTQKLQAHLPMLVHPNPRRVLEIGYGVGELAHTLLLYKPQRLHLVEIDEHMIPMAEEYFDALNEHASRNPAVSVDVMDGRQFLKTSNEQFDVIMSDSMILVSEQSLRLYTEEHFREARHHLRPGGLVLAWLPLNVGNDKVLVIIKTFLRVFPQTLLWLPLGWNRSEAFLVGFRDEARIDWASWHDKYERVAREDLRVFGWDSPAFFFASFRAGPERLTELAARVPVINRDMNPVLDFVPPGTPDVDAAVRDLVADPAGDVLAHLHADFAASEEVRALRDEVHRVHEADQLFLQGVESVDEFGARSAAEWLENSETLAAGFRRALDVYPRHHAAAVWLARVLRNAALAQPPLRPDEARGLLKEALRYDPSDSIAAESLARQALRRGEADEAREYVQRIRTFSPYFRLTPSETW
jgi:spermidine synthase